MYVVIVREVTSTMIVPSADGVNQSSGVHRPHSRCEIAFRCRSQLSPAFVVDHPSVDRGKRAMLLDQKLELSFPFCLFLYISQFQA